MQEKTSVYVSLSIIHVINCKIIEIKASADELNQPNGQRFCIFELFFLQSCKYRTLVMKYILTLFLFAFLLVQLSAQNNQLVASQSWKSPDEDILKVLHAPYLPKISTSPTGEFLLLSDYILYPELEELAAPMHKLAGIRVNPANNNYHSYFGTNSPRLVDVNKGQTIPINLPKNAKLHSVKWSVDGKRYAMSVGFKDRIELWLGDQTGRVEKVENIKLNPLMDQPVQWLPDQKRLLIRNIANRAPKPKAPEIPYGPIIQSDAEGSARSTYEARNLLETPFDDTLFSYYSQCELVVYDPKKKESQVIGPMDHYSQSQFSPDGKYILIERLTGPWSHEVAFWRFAHQVEVWDQDGQLVSKVASLPLADNVPAHGVPEGPRAISWRPTSPHTLYWIEALDGGDPVAEVPFRDKLMRLKAPFNKEAEEVFKAEHRIQEWYSYWGEKDNLFMLSQHERMKRRKHVWLIDVEENSARKWYELDERDRYANPGRPVFKRLSNGQAVFKMHKNGVYFRGKGGNDKGDRPFLDIKDLQTGKTDRLFRCDTSKYEHFVHFAGSDDEFFISSESQTEVPNIYKVKIGKEIQAQEGEGKREIAKTQITNFKDPTPALRSVKKEIVQYQREDGVPLNFELLLPPGYKEGEQLPTVVYAYPLEYSGSDVAGQVRGSANKFMRIYGPSHYYFLLRGYAVLHNTAMPMIGDPENVYDSFVDQLVADAEAAVNKAVDMGIADPDRIGVIGHSHGGLMVANLLAHTDLFSAGIARSGSYNKTNQPFGFQSERRSLFEARETYINVSPTFFADQVNEPVLIIHGNDDSNPGTLTFQSRVFYDAVRGSGGTARLVLLPYEDHGYRGRQSVEHVLWEQLRWFDMHVKNKQEKEPVPVK